MKFKGTVFLDSDFSFFLYTAPVTAAMSCLLNKKKDLETFSYCGVEIDIL
jgi:hypothetical protein